MLTIKCMKNGEPFETNLYLYTGKDTPEEVREIANSIWDSLLKDPKVSQLRGYLPDGTVLMPKGEKPMTWGVLAKYSDKPDAKMYPFECDIELAQGTRFISLPNGVPSIATVVYCNWTEREKVVKACNGHKLVKIKEILKAV